MSTQHGSHWLDREDVGEITVVRFKTPKVLDDNVTRLVFDSIYSLISGMRRDHLVLNLGAVECLSSMALGKLVMLNRKAQVGNGRLALCQLAPTVAEVFAVTHLDSLFQIYRTEQEALQSF